MFDHPWKLGTTSFLEPISHTHESDVECKQLVLSKALHIERRKVRFKIHCHVSLENIPQNMTCIDILPKSMLIHAFLLSLVWQLRGDGSRHRTSSRRPYGKLLPSEEVIYMRL